VSDRVAVNVQVDPSRHELGVTMRIQGAAAEGTVRVESPTWVPGDYSFETFGRDLFALHAIDAGSGGPLRVSRDGWQASSRRMGRARAVRRTSMSSLIPPFRK
jgi:predicted metalloprotease with PDZ domain